MDEFFDKWFKETYPEYMSADGQTPLEPYYSIASEAYETGFDKGYGRAEEHYLKVLDSQHRLVDESRKREEKKFEEEKCELLGIIQQKDELIGKMRNCGNCGWWYNLPDGSRDCAETCENLDNWKPRA